MLKRIELYDTSGKCHEIEGNKDISSVCRIVLKYNDGRYEEFFSKNATASTKVSRNSDDEKVLQSNRIRYMLYVIGAIKQALTGQEINMEKVRNAYNSAVKDLASKENLTEPSIRAKFIRSTPSDFSGNKTDYWLQFLAEGNDNKLKSALLASCEGCRNSIAKADRRIIEEFFQK